MLKNGGLKKIYHEIFPKESKASKLDVVDLESKKDVENFVEEKFNDKKKIRLPFTQRSRREDGQGRCVIQ